MPFARFSDERIFKPLGLANTKWRDDFTEIVPGRAQAYARRGSGWRLDMPNENVHGPGGLLTTVHDWLRWNDHLDRKTLGAGVVDSLVRQAVLTNGRKIQYAMGIMVVSYRGIPEWSHSGSTGGYSTFLARYPGRGLSVAVMCNAAGAPATQFTHALVDALVTDFPTAPPLDTVATDPAAIAKLAGIYRSTRTHQPLVVGSEGGGRGGRGGAAVPRALRDGSYLLANGRATFDVAPDGTPRGIRIATNDGDTTTWVFVSRTPWTPTAEQLSAFAGRYRSDEVGTTWTATVENGRLVLRQRASTSVELTPVYADAFGAGGTFGTVWFTRDARGAVTAMHSGAARVWDIAFTREKP
jgi:CubicO group peptidase (beta-lactamase class C family)